MFYHYSFVCGEIRRERHLIDGRQYAYLRSFLFTEEDPPTELLSVCFPDAYQTLLDSASSKRSVWDVDLVRRVWRVHVGKNPDCAVMCGSVQTVEGLGGWVVKENGQPIFVRNLFRFPISVGDRVYFHKSVVAEVEKKGERL